MAMDEGGRCVIRTREGRLSLPELAMPAASGGGDGQVADGAHRVTLQPAEESPTAMGAHGGGGGSLKGS
jgi:hypothetical protein